MPLTSPPCPLVVSIASLCCCASFWVAAVIFFAAIALNALGRLLPDVLSLANWIYLFILQT